MSTNRIDRWRSPATASHPVLSQPLAEPHSTQLSDSLPALFRRQPQRASAFSQSSQAAASPRSRQRPARKASSKGFNIEFDYRFDTKGWFTPRRRAVLEAAARLWERIILDDFPNTPKGRRTSGVFNPQTDRQLQYKTDAVIDDLRIFVGSQDLGTGVLAIAGPSATFTKRYTGANFEPWIGSISFNPTINWFFDRTPKSDFDLPFNQYDFLSTAAHEIGHVLGFLTGVNAFFYQLSGNSFAGANTIAVNAGFPLPLDPGGSSHIADGYETLSSGEALMDPVQFPGKRTRPTVLDAAVMDDLGYRVNYNATFRNASAFRLGQRRAARTNARTAYARCGCAFCLTT